MKKLFVLGLVLLSSLQMLAQDRSDREQIKALKTAYITEGLNLSPEEAQKFWPVYNRFEGKRIDLRRREHADIENMECISENEANKMVQAYVEIEREDYLLQKEFFDELREIFSAKRIIQLKKVEDDFHRKLLKEYRARKSKNVQ